MIRDKHVRMIVALTIFLNVAAKAAILELTCSVPAGPEMDWAFDYDLQVLTLKGSVDENSLLTDVPALRVIVLSQLDSDSTYTVVEDFKNDTGVALAGFTIWPEASAASAPIYFIEGSASATGPSEIDSFQSTIHVEWLAPILTGESFTIQFDMFTGKIGAGPVVGSFVHMAVPEPATITLLGLSGLVIFRKTREHLANI